MSERIEKIADEILAVVNKKRASGKTPENDVWVATYLPNREQIAVIFGDREVSNSYVQHRFKKDDRASIISTLEKLYGAEPRNHNEQSLDEDTVYDHSWYEVEDGDYPERTKEGVEIKETTCAGSVACVGKRIGKIGKRKRSKVSEDLKSKLFKESILNDMPCETEIENHTFKYFMNEGKWYMGVDNCLVKTHDKGVMMETFDQIVDELPITTSLLEDYSCFEMELLMEEDNTIANPNDSESPLVQGPSNNELVQPGIASDVDTPLMIQAKVEKQIQDKDKENPTTSTATSQEQADNEKRIDKLAASKGQKGILQMDKNGDAEEVTINNVIKTGMKDKEGKEQALVNITDKSGNKKDVLSDYMNKETL